MAKITLNNLYRQYPYKCVKNAENQGRNWIPIKERNCESKYSIDLSTYKDIMKQCFEVMIDNYLLRGRVVSLPYNFGDIQIKKYKPKGWRKAGIDWKATNENIAEGNRQYIYQSLAHSDGMKWCMTWKKNRKSFKGQTFWRFHLHPKTRRYISKHFTDNPLLINKFNLR